MVHVLEKKLVSKDSGPGLDAIAITSRFAAVIDQSTPKDPTEADLITPLLAEFERIDPAADISAAELVEQLSDALRPFNLDTIDRPCATVVILDGIGRRVIRVGDGHVVIDGSVHRGANPVDEALGLMRSLVLALDAAPSDTWIEGLDLARDAILPYMRLANRTLRNNASSRFGFGAIDGTKVPEIFVEEFLLPRVRTRVSIMTDGYPLPAWTLAECEAALERLLNDDPAMSSINATKGLLPNARSFDDRAFVCVELPDDG